MSDGWLEFRPFYRRRLPHYQRPGDTFFITFRLAGSLPESVLQALREEWLESERAIARIADEATRRRREDEEQRRWFGRWDGALDAATTGPKWLADRRVAALVASSLHKRDGSVWTLLAYCIMPNHGHLVSRPLPGADGSYQSLAHSMHSLKLYTARRGNALLGRQGQFWQHESYDHTVRDDAELRRIVEYVWMNPVKARLVACPEDWEWSYRRMEL